MSQVKLATHLRETQTFISKCERGERRLDIIELRTWCCALNVDLLAFLERLNANLTSDISKPGRIGKHPVKSIRISKQPIEKN